MAQPYLEQLQQLVNHVGLDVPDIDCRHFFSGAAAYAHGKIFASLTPKGLALKFPEPRCSELLAEDFAEPLRYFDQSPIKRGYVLIPDLQKIGKNALRQYWHESASAASQTST